jgi:hypothetical protein
LQELSIILIIKIKQDADLRGSHQLKSSLDFDFDYVANIYYYIIRQEHIIYNATATYLIREFMLI